MLIDINLKRTIFFRFNFFFFLSVKSHLPILGITNLSMTKLRYEKNIELK